MPGVTGVELTRLIRKKYPAIHILALSMHGEIAVIKQMLDSGISGYLLKNTGKAELIEALKKVARGDAYFSPEITRELMKAVKGAAKHNAHLTNREIEIIRLIEKEMGNKQIADTLCISERTVETHRKNIFRKTDTQSIIGLLKFAYEHKII
jgi:two-component system, NarL family, nitrate/nitrite response regulator NarL